MSVNQIIHARTVPSPAAALELLKPITWFPPMWAYGCGVVSAGVAAGGQWGAILLGVALAGPLVCGMSQAVNDWYDRHVDAINEPGRPIPSGRMPGRWGLGIAVGMTLVSLIVAASLGPWAFGAALVGIAMAWAYSAPPLRLKRNGWVSNLVCGLCYEGVPWFTGAAVMRGDLPDAQICAVALAYALGAHGILTLNDFKSIEGDRALGLRSLPVQLGPARAARLACATMALAQVAVMAMLAVWGLAGAAGAVGLVLAAQLWLMRRLLADPRGRAPWYGATGISLYVLGMLAAAIALGGRA